MLLRQSCGFCASRCGTIESGTNHCNSDPIWRRALVPSASGSIRDNNWKLICSKWQLWGRIGGQDRAGRNNVSATFNGVPSSEPCRAFNLTQTSVLVDLRPFAWNNNLSFINGMSRRQQVFQAAIIRTERSDIKKRQFAKSREWLRSLKFCWILHSTQNKWIYRVEPEALHYTL